MALNPWMPQAEFTHRADSRRIRGTTCNFVNTLLCMIRAELSQGRYTCSYTPHFISRFIYTDNGTATHLMSFQPRCKKNKSTLVMMSSHISGNMYPSLQSSTMVPRHATAKPFCQNPNAWVRDPTYSEHQMCVHCILAIPGARASISEVAALRKPGSWSPGLLPRGICPEQSFRALVKFEAYPAVIKASNDRHRPGGVFRITPTPGC